MVLDALVEVVGVIAGGTLDFFSGHAGVFPRTLFPRTSQVLSSAWGAANTGSGGASWATTDKLTVTILVFPFSAQSPHLQGGQ